MFRSVLTVTVAFFLAAAFLFWLTYAPFAHPSLSYVEQALALTPGRTFQRTLPDGEIITLEFQRVKPLGHDEYSIVVKLLP